MVTGLVRSYEKLQQMIAQKERHPISYWINLIQKVTVEREGEADIQQPIPFEEFQKWARALGIREDGSKNDSYQKRIAANSLRAGFENIYGLTNHIV